MSQDKVQEILDAMSAAFEKKHDAPFPQHDLVLSDAEWASCMEDLVAMGLEPTLENLEAEATKIIGPCRITRWSIGLNQPFHDEFFRKE